MQVRRPGLDDEPGLRIRERRADGRLGDGALRLEDLALDPEHVQHLLGADVRARDLVDGLRSRAQRDDEERGVAVEGDQVADVDLPREREAGAEPGDEDDEEARG